MRFISSLYETFKCLLFRQPKEVFPFYTFQVVSSSDDTKNNLPLDCQFFLPRFRRKCLIASLIFWRFSIVFYLLNHPRMPQQKHQTSVLLVFDGKTRENQIHNWFYSDESCVCGFKFDLWSCCVDDWLLEA